MSSFPCRAVVSCKASAQNGISKVFAKVSNGDGLAIVCQSELSDIEQEERFLTFLFVCFSVDLKLS